MKLFKCQACGQPIFFENDHCEKCGHPLGFLPAAVTLSALEAEGASWRALAAPGRLFRFCANADYKVCNWLVAADGAETFCLACRHNRTIPNLAEGDNIGRWGKLEVAKHRLIFTLCRLGLPLRNRIDDPERGLAFDFVAEGAELDGARVLTGHDNGIITVAITEADDAERERQRQMMGEAYRTPLGHFRHEIGHYYWDRLVQDGGELAEFRHWFGDERQDYAAALDRHYAAGPPPDWRAGFVSAYASMHPWEDFAETWAHLLHIVDTLETAAALGLQIHPRVDQTGGLHGDVDFDPHRADSIQQLVEAWLPVAMAMNCLSRSMGHADLYPFVLSPTVIGKLGMVQGLIRHVAEIQQK